MPSSPAALPSRIQPFGYVTSWFSWSLEGPRSSLLPLLLFTPTSSHGHVLDVSGCFLPHIYNKPSHQLTLRSSHMIFFHSESTPTNLPTAQYDSGIYLTEGPSSQLTLTCVNLTNKTKYKQTTTTKNPNQSIYTHK